MIVPMGIRAACSFFVLSLWIFRACVLVSGADTVLRFNGESTFKVLQVADMHYGNGATTPCSDIKSSEMPYCSDLNTTAFVRRMIQKEAPDLIVYTGDNIDWGASDAKTSMDAAFAPAIESNIPWAAILGNHDVDSNLPRPHLMEYISQMKNSLAKVLDPQAAGVHGWGNYYLSVFGSSATPTENTSLLNLYFLDSGDNSKLPEIRGYDWIRRSQQTWFSSLSQQLRMASPAPALAFFHIPIPEYDTILYRDQVTGRQLEDVYSAPINSGFFSTLLESGDVQATFVGHDHLNDYCGKLMGVNLCYGGGTGYHAYGRVGVPRRARVIFANLNEPQGRSLNISTWKRLDDSDMTKIDEQLLYSKATDVRSPVRTFAYRKGCSWPWSPFKYPQGKCFFWSSVIYTGVVTLLSIFAFFSGFLFHRYRHKSSLAYKPLNSENKDKE
ncbi:hypothetical protein MPTK1_8g14380 [Marchantia polymorpha subsp. ruderalis]|uniref:Calcineurin-like phosphoesterase domain-containing protein n=1 Tax=Marchantia polymorpha TaxID=3197 RepID=A0A2R6WCZ0_MARPO|nr:hypothetical protein MARPO_0108s0065 [Marchantia polymorpha]BBN19867.1 hypothetical protein Mp_8g14380 [Marchantia polymorpha subsp. ruderalis]|eukprot:PTQ31720.1 hypothetical protein MARPO_0108s0065 [Marchantia polymorpha]